MGSKKSKYYGGAGKLLLESYGGMATVMSYMAQLEQTKLQALNKWAYRVAVGRVQVSIRPFNCDCLFTTTWNSEIVVC